MAPAYDKASGSLYQRERMFVDVSGTAYPVERGYVKVAGSLYEFFGGGTAYALLETGTDQTTLYAINLTTGALSIQGSEQAVSGVDTINGIGCFTLGSTAYAFMETAETGGNQTTLYAINTDTGALSIQGSEQTVSGVGSITGIGTFVVGSTAYALLEAGPIVGDTRTQLFTINLTTGALTLRGISEQISGAGVLAGMGTFVVGSTAYALLETGTDQTTLFTINLTTGALSIQGTEQTVSGVGGATGIGTFVVGSTAYALIEVGTDQTTLYAINLSTGALAIQGSAQTLSGLGGITGIGCFVI